MSGLWGEEFASEKELSELGRNGNRLTRKYASKAVETAQRDEDGPESPADGFNVVFVNGEISRASIIAFAFIIL